MKTVFKICGCLKNYEWGKSGYSSVVAQLQKSAFDDFAVDESAPYAELWMGTHSSGPATIPSLGGMKLIDWILAHPESLGRNISKQYDPTKGLPFLFKVLSVKKPLSIQVHPDKPTAEKLFKADPDHYPDDNHKPEMAIALTNFEALCGFRPISEIKGFLRSIPWLQKVIGLEMSAKFLEEGNQKDLKQVFVSLMTCSPAVFQSQLENIVNYFQNDKYEDSVCKDFCDLFLKVYGEYPGDIGCFCLFFLNYLKLDCGEAIYLAANEPHAYLYGDCIECMACSDNVVRAGLTPKFCDVVTLCDILTYNCKPPQENLFQFVIDPQDPCVKIYDPPIKEFAIDKISFTVNQGEYELKSIPSASILLVIKGSGFYRCEDEEILSSGTILFISSDVHILIKPTADLLMFRAYCKC